MISKSTIKLIKSLAVKKFRLKENLFLVEGDKNVIEVLNSSYSVDKLFATNLFLENYSKICKKANFIFEVENTDIKNASLLKTPQSCLAICTLPPHSNPPKQLENNLSIFLDDIQDPGNLGTIIRICDWFNIEHLFCSPNTVDMYNPKVIQASMGSFCRIQTTTATFECVEEIAHLSNALIFGAFLDGKNIYKENLPQKAILVMGNEGNGIQKEIEKKISNKIQIPEFSVKDKGAESLNVSVATAIICSEFKRQIFL
ncbi:MAG: RNA methyltransferase [Bacteroidetes bacterium]|nr:RNA methyltransferase [Bacteroidota bacterium]